MTRPLAEVEGMVTTAGGFGGVKIGHSHAAPRWGVNGLWDREGEKNEPPAKDAATEMARDINDAHLAVVEPLLARLAMAREALARVRDHHWREVHPGYQAFDVRFHPEERSSIAAAVAAIDADPPGEWVPAEKYRQLELVLADASQDGHWRARCERALARCRVGDGTNELLAILEGKR